jgi:hypothetical protein
LDSVFFWWIFATWRQKEAGESNKWIFEILRKKKTTISWQKKLRSCQIWTVCSCRSPELGRIPKKIY